MKRELKRGWIVCWVMIFAIQAYAQNPSAKGSFPTDGADQMIRNAYVAVALDLKGQRLNPQTVNHQNVRLYPSGNPGGTVSAFISLDEDLDQVILEPREVLAPNTPYTFEMTEDIKDVHGTAFIPYKISFRTGVIAFEKKITMRKGQTTESAFAARKGRAAPERSTNIALSSRYVTPKEKEAQEKQKEEQQEIQKEIRVMEEMTKVSETESLVMNEATLAVATPNLPENLPTLAVALTPEKMEVPENIMTAEIEPAPVLTESISFPKNIIYRDGGLPIEFTLLERNQIKFQLLDKTGRIVKKQGGYLEAGKQNRSLSMKGLPPGEYRAEIEVGSVKATRLITILK